MYHTHAHTYTYILRRDYVSGASLGVLPNAHAGWVRGVAISADGSKCYSGGADKQVKTWDLVSWFLCYSYALKQHCEMVVVFEMVW